MTNASPALRPLPGGVAVVVVRGRSMLPTLRDGDRLLVRVLPPDLAGGCDPAGGVRPGRLVVVRFPGDRPVAVKRLVAVQDDGAWWVQRDNPREGVDSWSLGEVTGADRLAVVLARLWPRPGRPGGGDAGPGRRG